MVTSDKAKAGSCCGRLIFFRFSACHDSQRAIRQWSLKSFGLIPRRAHPHVVFLLCGQDHRHGLWVDRFNDRVWRRRQEAVDQMRAGDRLRLGATVALELGPEPAEGEQRSVFVERNQTTSFFLVSGFGSGAYSAKLLAGTKQRLSGFSQPRQ